MPDPCGPVVVNRIAPSSCVKRQRRASVRPLVRRTGSADAA